MKVRAARLEDEAALLEIDQATWSPMSSPAPEPSPGPFFNERTQPEDVVVAEIDGRTAGWGKITHPTPMPSSRHVWHVTGLAVDPEFEGRGAGRALMEALIDEARARDGRRLTLRVFRPNERAQRLYERLGFELEGVLRGEFRVGEDEYVDDLCMALDLTTR
ncbi:MAG TPA: GNAT family N-acetyltransferase [Thermoleophilaceae bacterium]|nr:GNAT family N-acetyltransferase [Thermoleophilaceae bacterium]